MMILHRAEIEDKSAPKRDADPEAESKHFLTMTNAGEIPTSGIAGLTIPACRKNKGDELSLIALVRGTNVPGSYCASGNSAPGGTIQSSYVVRNGWRPPLTIDIRRGSSPRSLTR